MLPGDGRYSSVSGPRSNIGLRLQRPKADLYGHSGLLFLLGGLLIAVNDKRQLRRVPCSRGRHLSRSFASRAFGSV